MANKFPLIVNTTTNRIAELPAGDNLDLSLSNIANVANIDMSGSLNAGITQLHITGGSSGQYVTTDGLGNLTFATPSISVAQTVSNAAQPNITSTGTLTGANINGTINLFSDVDAGIAITDYGLSAADAFDFGVAQARGTKASPAALQVGDNLFKLTSAGYTGNGTTTWDGSTGWKAYSPFYHYISALPAGANGMFGTNVRIVTSNATSNTAATNFTFDDAGNFTIPNSVISNNAPLLKFNETVPASTNTSTSISPDMATGSIFRYTANSNFTFNGLTNAVAGSSATVIVTQDATGSRTLTSTMKFAGGSKTLSTAAGTIDIISVFYDGTNYYASLTKGYA